MKTLKIDNIEINRESPPYIIAELSANHAGCIERAFEIMDAAKKAGADAVKLQTYTADTLTINSSKPEFCIQGGLWGGRTLYDLYKEAHTPWEWHKALFEKAKELSLTIFSSPFDSTAVDFLEDLNVPAYKIASFECIDLPLIKYVAQTGKPMIISTGMANADEIEEAVICARDNGCKELALLHCVSGYPAPAQDYNLKTIQDMVRRFDCLVGLSDHTLDNTTALASIALGACIIEKHVTLDRCGGGPDDSFSLEPQELKALCEDSGKVWQALGKVDYTRKESEKSNVLFRRSLYIVEDVKEGDVVSSENVRSIRPGYGLLPKHMPEVLDRVFNRSLKRGTALDWNYLQ